MGGASEARKPSNSSLLNRIGESSSARQTNIYMTGTCSPVVPIGFYPCPSMEPSARQTRRNAPPNQFVHLEGQRVVTGTGFVKDDREDRTVRV